MNNDKFTKFFNLTDEFCQEFELLAKRGHTLTEENGVMRRNRKYQQRRRDKPKHIRFTEDVKQLVNGLLNKDFSPEQIAGKTKIDGKPCVALSLFTSVFGRTKKRVARFLHTSGEKDENAGSKVVLKVTGVSLKASVDVEQIPAIVG